MKAYVNITPRQEDEIVCHAHWYLTHKGETLAKAMLTQVYRMDCGDVRAIIHQAKAANASNPAR